jgi:hypothetical protein
MMVSCYPHKCTANVHVPDGGAEGKEETDGSVSYEGGAKDVAVLVREG